MRLKYYFIFPLLALFLTLSVIEGHGYTHVKPSSHPKKPLHRLTSGNKSNFSLANPVESVPVINLQAHKIIHHVQAIFTALSDFSVCLKCYNFFSGNGNHPLASSKKIFLFPFHVFW